MAPRIGMGKGMRRDVQAVGVGPREAGEGAGAGVRQIGPAACWWPKGWRMHRQGRRLLLCVLIRQQRLPGSGSEAKPVGGGVGRMTFHTPAGHLYRHLRDLSE